MVTVDPEQVHDYANQLSHNAFALEDLTAHITAHCNKTRGMIGHLVPAAAATLVNAGLLVEAARSGARNLEQLCGTLHEAAEKYHDRDVENAERLVKSYDDAFAGLPFGYTETDTTAHQGDYSDVNAVSLKAPPESRMFEEKIELAKEKLSFIESEMQKLFGFSVAADLLAPLFGNWDAMQENGQGYESLAEPSGALAIRDNILYGLDSLSASWEGEGATSLDFVIRRRWSGFIEYFSSCCAFQGAVWQATAQEAGTVFDMLVTLLVDAAGDSIWTLPVATIAARPVGSYIDGTGSLDELNEVLMFYIDFVGEVKQIVELMVEVLHLWVGRVKTGAAMLRLLIDISQNKAYIPTR